MGETKEVAAVDQSSVVAMSPEQFKAFLASLRGDQDDQMKRQAEYDAQAMKRALRPENDTLPGPPRTEPKCRILHFGMPVGTDVYSEQAICLMNQLEPGTFTVTKSDRSKLVVTVEAERDHLGQMTVMKIVGDVSGDKKHNMMPLEDMLQDMLAQQQAASA